MASDKLIFDILKGKDTLNPGLKQASKESNFLGDTLKVATGVIGAGLVTSGFKAFSDSVRSAINTVSEFTTLAGIQEDSVNSLNLSLAQAGKYSVERSKDFQSFASSLQESTRFGDEAILQNAALIQSLGKLDTDGLKRATTAATDLSAALGIDLRAAATLVGKAASGEVSSFSRYGVSIKKAATNAQTFENALVALEGQFGGAAAGKVNTYSGALEQLENTIGDTKEVAGALITQNPLVVASFQGLSKVFLKIQKVISENEEAFKSFITDGIYGAIDGISVISEAFLGFNGIVNGTQNFINFLSDILLGLGQSWSEMALSINEATQSTRKFLGLGVSKVLQEEEQLLKRRIGIIEQTRNANDLETAQRIKNQESLNETVRKTVSEAQETLRAEVAAAEEAEAGKTNAFLQGLSDRNAAKVGDLEVDKELLAQKEELKNLESELDKLRDEENLTYLRENLGLVEAEREQARALELENQAKHDASIKEQIKAKTAAVKQLTAAQSKAQQNDIFAVQKFEELSNRQRLANLQSTFGTIASLQSSSSKELFAIGKAAAIATATIDGIQAVQKALASAPPPFNFALAAAVGVVQASNLSKIASSKPTGFESGGVIGGTSFTGDKVPAFVNSGEAILNKQQGKEITDKLNGGGGMSAKIDELISVIRSQPIVVAIDGREIASAVREQSLGGFQLA